MFWSTEKFAEEAASQPELIAPFDRSRLKSGAYELSLGQGAVSSRDIAEVRRISTPEAELKIPPGQFALLMTSETVAIPANAIALISMKATVKLGGLTNISGFHVDPGFRGRLKFSVYNAGDKPVILTLGRPVFQIWLVSLDRTTGDPYRGDHQKQLEITDRDLRDLCGDVPSPAALQDSLHKLEERIEGKFVRIESRFVTLEERRAAWTAIWTGSVGNIVGAVIGVVLGFVLGLVFSRETQSTVTAQVQLEKPNLAPATEISPHGASSITRPADAGVPGNSDAGIKH